MERNTRYNLMILCVSIIIALIIGEIAIRLYYKQKGWIIGIDEEERCNRDQYYALRDTNNEYRFYPISMKQYEYWNYTGVRPKPNVYGDFVFNMSDGKKIVLWHYHTNSQGMRNLRSFSRDKMPNTTRMAFLGDSFTWGADVPLKLSFVGVLDELVPNSEALNLGIEGTGIGEMYLRWKYEALNYDPDIVVYTIFVGDIYRISPCIYKPKFNIIDGKLVLTNLPPPTLDEIYKNYKPPIIENYLLKHLIHSIKYRKSVEFELYKYGLERLDLILDEMKAKSDEDGTYLIVPVIRHGNDKNNTEIEEFAIQQLFKMLDKKDIPYVDSQDVFKRQGYIATGNDNVNIFDHFRPEGYAYFAQGIKNKLESDGIIQKTTNYRFYWDMPSRILFMEDEQNSSRIEAIIPYTIMTKEDYKKYVERDESVNLDE